MSKHGIKYYIKDLLTIAAPIIMGNLGFILIGLGDVVIAGRHSTDTFAAISIANAFMSCLLTFGVGLICGVSPLLSNYRGQKKSIKKYFFPSIRFSMSLSIIILTVILGCITIIPYMGFEERLVPDIQNYMLITAFSIFGVYLHACLKDFLQAFEIVFFPNLVTIICVFLNVILNIILVFGCGPIPALGVTGLAIASFIVRYVMAFVLLIYCYRIMQLRDYHERGYYRALLNIGLPISLAILVEFVAFNSIAIFMGRVSGVYAAVQNLVCTLTTVSFMVPFAISNAIAVKTGFANGANDLDDLKKYSYVGVAMGVGFMICSAILFSTFPNQLIKLFTNDESVLKITLPVMYVLSVFQVFDGLQISLAGICKGVKQTDIVLLANFIAYWCVSIPLGYILAFKFNMNLSGFWIGLTAAAIILCFIMTYKLKKFVEKRYN